LSYVTVHTSIVTIYSQFIYSVDLQSRAVKRILALQKRLWKAVTLWSGLYLSLRTAGISPTTAKKFAEDASGCGAPAGASEQGEKRTISRPLLKGCQCGRQMGNL
jgi:hypothetical protein